jgi:hypothetical protein
MFAMPEGSITRAGMSFIIPIQFVTITGVCADIVRAAVTAAVTALSALPGTSGMRFFFGGRPRRFGAGGTTSSAGGAFLEVEGGGFVIAEATSSRIVEV